MGIISIIYLIVIATSCVCGACVGINSIIKTRNRNIKQFYENRKKRRKEFENG